MAMTTPVRAEGGFTLLELLIATAIMLFVLASIFALLNPAEGTFRAQPEVSDLQQRVRVSVDTLVRDLMMAGAGPAAGEGAGPLIDFFAPILPSRAAGTGADPSGTFRADAITLIYVPETVAQATLASALHPAAASVGVTAGPGCPVGDPVCGFEAGMHALVFDRTGAWSPVAIESVASPNLGIQRYGPDLTRTYDAGSPLAQVSMHTYFLKDEDHTQTWQLIHHDGFETDLPVADNIVGLTFEYWGAPQPPTLLEAVSADIGPWTTYGPRPPAAGVFEGAGYEAGGNCVFQVVDGRQVPRLPDLSPASTALVPLPAAMLTDGPWCPGPASPARFDADLLRIRHVRVTLRVQVASGALRGPPGRLFAKGGWARGGEMYVPDQEVRFDVVPRNMNLGR
jgi:hypothetical protein